MNELSGALQGICDTHIHVYDPARFALQNNATSPPHATWPDYLALRADLGLSRAVIVQPVGYGFDNRCTLDALAQAKDSARAILTLPADVSDAQLQKWDEQGVRGVRFMMIPGVQKLLTWDDLPVLARRIAPWQWTINLQLDGRTLAQYESMLDRLPCPLVIDHTAKFLEPAGLDHSGWQALCRLMDTGRVWVKLSAPYETSRTGAPDYRDVATLARELARLYPQRCLWASNWPHPGQATRPDERALLNLMHDWAGDQNRLQRILVDNPAALYRF